MTGLTGELRDNMSMRPPRHLHQFIIFWFCFLNESYFLFFFEKLPKNLLHSLRYTINIELRSLCPFSFSFHITSPSSSIIRSSRRQHCDFISKDHISKVAYQTIKLRKTKFIGDCRHHLHCTLSPPSSVWIHRTMVFPLTRSLHHSNARN